jgi:SPP1 family predicted phage head-tail adaptor
VYKLNRRITIHRYTTQQNDIGGLEAVETGNWTKWAEARNRLGNNRNDYYQRQWTYDQIFVMRYETERPTRSNDVIEYEGQFFKINYLQIQEEGAKDWEYVYATKVDESIN